MNEVVFISDLHLHPNVPQISQYFEQFIQWAGEHTRSVYILGDFFHVWVGDDDGDAWSLSIAQMLLSLAQKGIRIYFMPGNRDFMLGDEFLNQAHMMRLLEPSVIQLGADKVVLVHGDAYCTLDVAHQWLRWFTRNRYFFSIFSKIPRRIRKYFVQKVRHYSQNNHQKKLQDMAIVAEDLLHHLQSLDVQTVIHGHIHQPGLVMHEHEGRVYRQYVLSDWDHKPSILCYSQSQGLYYLDDWS